MAPVVPVLAGIGGAIASGAAAAGSAIAAGAATIGSAVTAGTAAIQGTGLLSAASTVFKVGSVIASVAGVLGGQKAVQVETNERVDAANHNAQIASYNVQVAEQNANQAIAASQQRAEEIRQQSRRRISTIRSRFAKGGVVTTEGSSLLAQLEQAEEDRYAIDQTLYEGKLQSNAYKSQANMYRQQIDYQNRLASNATRAGKINAGTSLLTGVSGIIGALT